MKKVLIVVDLQNGFCENGELPVQGGNSLPKIVNELMESGQFDLVVATQDWHPEGHSSFVPKGPWPVHCVQNTKSSEFHPELNLQKVDKIVQKGNLMNFDSLSGFWDNTGEHRTELEAYLKAQGVEEVYVCGLATEYCVKSTAVDSIKAGFKTFFIEDASKGVNPVDVANAVKDIANLGINVVQSNDILTLKSSNFNENVKDVQKVY